MFGVKGGESFPEEKGVRGVLQGRRESMRERRRRESSKNCASSKLARRREHFCEGRMPKDKQNSSIEYRKMDQNGERQRPILHYDRRVSKDRKERKRRDSDDGVNLGGEMRLTEAANESYRPGFWMQERKQESESD